MVRFFLCGVVLLTNVTGEEFAGPPKMEVEFEKIQLSGEYISEGASIGDINKDGKMDLVAGPRVWLGPDFKEVFSYAPLKKGPISSYSENFFTFPDFITKDEWVDILKVGQPGSFAELAVNPGEKLFPEKNTAESCEHCQVQADICNESPQYLDVIGDEGKELLAFSGGFLILARPLEDPKESWQVMRLSGKNPKMFKRYEHGLGAGDVNGDGFKDILTRYGWWEQPKDWDEKTEWIAHEYGFAPEKGGSQMFAYDVDGDGDNDVVTALNGHGYGMAWFEQVSVGGKIDFKKHTVMTDLPSGNPYGVCFSQLHAMDCADMDGDGIKDIVTGKCYFAHGGKDPGAKDPAVIYWFRTVRNEDGSAELVPYLIDDDSGVGRQITIGDLNGDGKPDIAVSNKKGVFAFLQK